LPLNVLNRDFWQWLENDYHQNVHSSTKETPLARYLKHIHLIREAPKDMEDYFRKRTTRRVHKDRTVSLNGRLFEAPTGLIGKIVNLLYHDHDPLRVEVLLNETSYGFLVPLDLHINCRIRRDHHTTEIIQKDNETQPDKTPDNYRNGKLFGDSND
jgi:putative transposase